MSLSKITLAQIDWINEDVPYSNEFDDVYFSTVDGIAESEYNFLLGNGLKTKFERLAQGQGFRIVETGFGSGLNFVLASDLWLKSALPSECLHYVAFEKYPLKLHDLIRAHSVIDAEREGLARISSELQQHYPLILPGWHDLYLFDKRIRLTIWFGDVLTGLPELDGSEYSKVDAWFLDGFAPVKNPDMWQPALYHHMARLSRVGTSFATFTAAGLVRRGLQKVGFEVEKSPGFGAKRERCFGVLSHVRPHSLKEPWYCRPQAADETERTAIVIGAGLAGAAVANQLAQAGFDVVVLEAEEDVATQASGNLAGTLHPLVTVDWNRRSKWYFQGLESTLRTLQPWVENTPQMGDLSGLIELQTTLKKRQRNQQAIERVGIPEALMTPLDKQKTAEILGVESRADAMFFPNGGWLYPRAVIEQCLEHPSISVVVNAKVSAITRRTDSPRLWRVLAADKAYDTHNVIVATGSLDANLNGQLGLPIRPVKGQVTHLDKDALNNRLQKAVIHDGYSVSHSTGAVTGASFEAPDMGLDLSMLSQQENIEKASKLLPDWLHDHSEVGYKHTLNGRIAFRPTTPDHLPIIGPVPDVNWLEEAYLSLSHTHAVYRYKEQRYQPGLFVSNGHGPRGLLSVFLAAESILADLMGLSPVQPLSLYHASHPARFAIRQWRSGKMTN